jgi:hypothetical protein
MWLFLPTTTWWNTRHTFSTFNYSYVQLCNYQFHPQVENHQLVGHSTRWLSEAKEPLTIHFSYAHSNLSELNLLTDLNLSVLRSTPSLHAQSSERAKLLCRFQEIKKTASPCSPSLSQHQISTIQEQSVKQNVDCS